MRNTQALITEVALPGAAARAGVRAGDRLLAVNGRAVRDVIDVQVYAAEATLTLEVKRAGKRLVLNVDRRYGEPLGLGFAEPLFDGIRRCHNRCDFCFVAQMPRGMRPTLYVRDDDYRLSFLHGSYITLTNLTEEDWARIEAQHLSPLYVSVHATEAEVRRSLLRHPQAGEIVAQLRRLVAMGIEVHTQAVLIPGRNDGVHLDRTIDDLAALYPGVADLTVVPVGLTRYHAPGLRPFTREEARATLEQIVAWQGRLRPKLGVNFVYPSDEWFLRAGREASPIPPLDAYDGRLPLLMENGVGMVRDFLEHRDALEEALGELGVTSQTWVTGQLFAAELRAFAGSFTAQTGVAVAVVGVPNRTFGETVTVAGLLTVRDVLAALPPDYPLGEAVILPAVMFRGPEGQALDGGRPLDVAEATDRPVYLVGREDATWQVTRAA